MNKFSLSWNRHPEKSILVHVTNHGNLLTGHALCGKVGTFPGIRIWAHV